MEAQGRLAMRWSSHGCQYGIGRSIDGSLEHGICVIVNGSRGYLPEALRRYPDLLPVLVEADPAILRQRLLARGKRAGPGCWRNVCSVRRRRCLPLLLSGSYASTTPGSWRRRSISWKTSCGLSCRTAWRMRPGDAGQRGLKKTCCADRKKGSFPAGKGPFLYGFVYADSQRASMRAAQERHERIKNCRHPQWTVVIPC